MSINSLGIKIVLVSILCGLTSCSTAKTSCTHFECSDPTVIKKPTSSRHFIPSTYGQYIMSPPALADSESDAKRIEKQRIVIINVRGENVYFDRRRGKLLKSSVGARFGEGLARVPSQKNGKEGFINERGEWAISPSFEPSDFERYQDVTNTNELHDDREVFHEGAAPVKVGGKYRFINKQGQFFTSSFDSVTAFDRGVAVVSVNSKYGLINKQGKFIIPLQFDKAPDVYHDRGGILVVPQNGRQQCLDNRGLSAPEHTCQNMLAEIENQKKKQREEEAKEKSFQPESAFTVENGAVYLNGKLLLDRYWNQVSTGCRGVYMYRVGDQWGVVHQSGEIKTPPQFDRIDELVTQRGFESQIIHCPFKNGLARVSVNGKMGFVDETGKFATPPKFEFVDNFEEDPDRTYAKSGSKRGLIDRQGNFINPPVLFGLRDSFDGRFSSVAVVKRKGKYEFIDRQGKLVVPARYDEIAINNPGSFRGVPGYYDSLGRDKLIQVRIGKKWGYINTSGIIQIPVKFDEAGFFKYGVAEVKVGAQTFYIDRQGKTLPF
jgi:WG containing repeat